MTTVAVLISTRNRSALLRKAVESAAWQKPDRIVIVDDASDDDTPLSIALLKGTYGDMIKHVANPAKSENWQDDLLRQVVWCGCDQVICMGDDDELRAGLIDYVRLLNAPVTFSPYHVRHSPDAEPAGVVPTFIDAAHPVRLSASDVSQRFTSPISPMETGIGSAMARDCMVACLRWGMAKLGPWSDCVAYSTIAALHGAAYLPFIGAVFTERADGYGATERAGLRLHEYHLACWEFVRAAGLSPRVAAAILSKRGVPSFWRSSP